VIARYGAGGTFDEDFGKRTLGKGTPAAVLAQSDGRIVVESRSAEADSRTLLARLGARGEPDTAFGRAGTAAVNLHGPDVPAGAALQRDGRILVAGNAGYDFSAARLTAGGAPDPGFGAGGSVFGFSGVNVASAAALQGDGKLVIAGHTLVGDTSYVALARLLADPAPRTGEGPTGPAHPPSVPRCAGRRATIVGTAGRDTLRGTRHADVIVALGGADRVLAGRGDDVVCGGAGRDRLNGGPGRDRLLGEGGRDVLAGGPGRDRLLGGPGRDRLAKETR
jgi:uncharacterized delta-60 repeat protein